MHSGTLFWVCILFGIRSTISYSDDADESIVLPKFGDRISPRTRTFIEVEKLRTTANSKLSAAAADIGPMSNPNYSADNHSNSINSINSNKTEHGFYLNDANASAIDSPSGSVSISYNEHSTNGPSRPAKHQQPQQHPLTNKKLAASLQYNNVYNDAESVEFDVIDSDNDNNDIYNAMLRQHKSLNVAAADSELSVENNLCNNKSEPCSQPARAQRADHDNEIDLRNGNSTSAQAHRLEMSTEFFVVPSTSSSSTIPSHHLPGGIYPSNPYCS